MCVYDIKIEAKLSRGIKELTGEGREEEYAYHDMYLYESVLMEHSTMYMNIHNENYI